MPRRSWPVKGGSNLWQKLKPQARRMRKEPTPEEAALWKRLRNGKLGGFKFRRQHPIDQYLADFCCPEVWLVIEIDGPIHERQVEEDALRQDHIERLGYRVIRFSNEDVIRNPMGVMRRIWVELNRENPGPQPSTEP
jgi:very-short-patch-repair endonuclease